MLEAGKAHVADRSKSSNAGAEVGVGVVVGAQTGVYVYAEASVGSSKANSDSNTWQNTTLTGQNISLKAEGDTTLRGATATADRIDVKTGGTLTIESPQDIAESMSKNSQVGGRVQVAFGNAWNADRYASAGKAEGSYQGVGQQSGLFAGNGGCHVDAGHVNLIGGAISSTNAANSELTAQTLTFSDLQNQMDYSASSGSISGGAGGQMKGWDAKEGTTAARGGPGMPMSEGGSDSSSTLATLTEGNITIGGKQTTAAELGINTYASAAHRALEAMPDATKLLADQQAMAGAIGTVVATSRQDANYSWVEDIFYRKKGANERLFENALRKSGLEPSRTEDLLPSSMQLRNYFAIQDAQTSSAMASIAFVAATVGDMSEDNRRALTLTMGGIANIAGIAISGKTGLLPQTGGLGVTRSPSRRRVSEAPATNALSVEQPKNQGGDSGGSSTKNFIPPGPVRVSDAHSVETIGAGTRFGGGNRNTLKSVLMGGV
nr:hemagglutinin repeat-containing protein [Stenotrophomonas indicatrix]